MARGASHECYLFEDVLDFYSFDFNAMPARSVLLVAVTMEFVQEKENGRSCTYNIGQVRNKVRSPGCYFEGVGTHMNSGCIKQIKDHRQETFFTTHQTASTCPCSPTPNASHTGAGLGWGHQPTTRRPRQEERSHDYVFHPRCIRRRRPDLNATTAMQVAVDSRGPLPTRLFLGVSPRA